MDIGRNSWEDDSFLTMAYTTWYLSENLHYSQVHFLPQMACDLSECTIFFQPKSLEPGDLVLFVGNEIKCLIRPRKVSINSQSKFEGISNQGLFASLPTRI